DALVVHEVEFNAAEGRGYFVLDDFHAMPPSDHLLAFFDLRDAANVEAHGGVELQRLAARRRFRVAEHDAYLHADLVDENNDGLGARDYRRELAQGLRHKARLLADVALAHVALYFVLGRQCRHRVDDDDVHFA